LDLILAFIALMNAAISEDAVLLMVREGQSCLR
jgi:hypothetical protein